MQQFLMSHSATGSKAALLKADENGKAMKPTLLLSNGSHFVVSYFGLKQVSSQRKKKSPKVLRKGFFPEVLKLNT